MCQHVCDNKIYSTASFIDFRHTSRLSNKEYIPGHLGCTKVPSSTDDTLRGYIMVANCPSSWKDEKTAQACLSTNYTADPLTALPVVDMVTNVTYANTYCVMCHKTSRDLHMWSLSMMSMKISYRKFLLDDIKSPHVQWKAVPVGTVPDKCILTPPEAKTAPDTKDKRLCRSYGNCISVKKNKLTTKKRELFKNPHCSLLTKQSLADKFVTCAKFWNNRISPLLRSTIFVFSIHGKESKNVKEKTVRVNASCQASEVYDPFKGKCLIVQSAEKLARRVTISNSTNATKQCSGPLFLPNEFVILGNYSAFIHSHQKIYKNDNYMLVNKTLVLCSNFSRYYNKTITTTMNNRPPQEHTLHIITLIGFLLSTIALLLLLVTYFLFAELRTYPGKAVTNLSCAMIGMQSVYFLSDPDVVSPAVCAVMGGLFHYFILVVFLWMSSIAHNTQKTFTALSENFTV